MINFWKSYKPLEPACIEPSFTLSNAVHDWVSNFFFSTKNSTYQPCYQSHGDHTSKSVDPTVLEISENFKRTSLDLQIGQHESVKLEVPIPNLPQSSGGYVLNLNEYETTVDSDDKALIEIALDYSNHASELGREISKNFLLSNFKECQSLHGNLSLTDFPSLIKDPKMGPVY